MTNYVFQLQFKNWRMPSKILFQNWNFVFLLFVEHFLPYKLSLEKFTYFTPNMFKRSLYLSNKAVIWKVHAMFLFTFLKKTGNFELINFKNLYFWNIALFDGTTDFRFNNNNPLLNFAIRFVFSIVVSIKKHTTTSILVCAHIYNKRHASDFIRCCTDFV